MLFRSVSAATAFFIRGHLRNLDFYGVSIENLKMRYAASQDVDERLSEALVRAGADAMDPMCATYDREGVSVKGFVGESGVF